MRTVTVGLLGCGTVGKSVLTLLERRRDTLEQLGVRLRVAGVLVRDASRPRDIPDPGLLTEDPAFLNGCGLLIEAMGGVDRPLELLEPYLASDRPLVTANKAMLAERWDVLKPHALAGRLYYEASVMAGTPVIGPMSTVLRASRFESLMAVVNGTCNFVLGQMEQGGSYQDALRQAQALGYAEDPPTLDVGGFDSAHKLAVLARFCADGDFPYRAISVTGIEGVTAADVADAKARGERYKLVARLERAGAGWKASVAPERLPLDHPLVTVGNTRNALVYHGEECGDLIFAGGGAGGFITASAVVGDVLDYLIGFPGHVPLH